MARSFKKNLILKIAPTRKAAPKRQASHRVRHVDELASGAAYKRCFNSWDIVILNPHFDTIFPGLLRKNKKFGGAVSNVEVFRFGHAGFSPSSC